MATSLVMANNAFDRTAGPHSLAAAGQRDRSPHGRGLGRDVWTS